MDVQCERCKTEYEFDDALVSGRGTTVRCTNCGHQFKVRRAEPDGAEDTGDRWQVRTVNGQQFTFVTLRELQRAILAGQVSRADTLRRSGAAARPLGSISELEPFFQGRGSTPPPPGSATPSMMPLAPTALPKRSASWEEDVTQAAPPPEAGPGAAGPSRRKVDTLRPPTGGAAPPPQGLNQAAAAPAAPLAPTQAAQPTPQRPTPQAAQVPARPTPPSSAVPRQSVMGRTQVLPVVMAPRGGESGAPPAAVGAAAPAPARAMAPPTTPIRRAQSSSEYPDQVTSMPPSSEEPYSASRGRRVGGWVVALVLMLAVGVVGWAVAKPYLIGRNAQAEAQIDPRALSYLSESEKAMADGNLDAAKQAVDKASALAESNPRVLLDEARVAAAQADIPWLKTRLLPADAADELRATKADLDDRVTRARRAADAALTGAPDDVSAIRARVDALRLAGDQEVARGLVSKIIAQASQPETAYILAALDLAEAEPLWKTVIERLRLAAAGEGNAGRARAGLIYALAKSGDTAGAKAELSKLDALTRPYPILPSLHAFVDRGSVKVAADAGAPSGAPRVASGTGVGPSAPAGGAAPVGGSPSGGADLPVAAGGAGDPIPTDPRVAIQAAAMAVRTGQLVRARQIYESIVTRNPGDSEALAGLGDIARLDGDPPLAISRYKHAIAVNPSYLPALLGLADTQWSSGDKGSAVKGYSEIVDRFPEGTYPAYVKQRSESGVGAPATGAAATKGTGSKTSGSE
jgi:predicted Zn finger-like uncharacterized protein